MSNPATPLDNKEAIAQMGQELRTSMSFLLSEFVRPTMLQTQANAQAIAETQAICDSNARSIQAEGEKVRALRESVEILRKVGDDVAAETSTHESRIAGNEKRFQNLLAEAREDRKQSDARFKEIAQRMDEERKQSDERFQAMQENIQRLLLEIRSTNGEVKQLGDRVTNLEAG